MSRTKNQTKRKTGPVNAGKSCRTIVKSRRFVLLIFQGTLAGTLKYAMPEPAVEINFFTSFEG